MKQDLSTTDLRENIVIKCKRGLDKYRYRLHERIFSAAFGGGIRKNGPVAWFFGIVTMVGVLIPTCYMGAGIWILASNSVKIVRWVKARRTQQ